MHNTGMYIWSSLSIVHTEYLLADDTLYHNKYIQYELFLVETRVFGLNTGLYEKLQQFS